MDIFEITLNYYGLFPKKNYGLFEKSSKKVSYYLLFFNHEL